MAIQLTLFFVAAHLVASRLAGGCACEHVRVRVCELWWLVCYCSHLLLVSIFSRFLPLSKLAVC